jgi:hypothetical protein
MRHKSICGIGNLMDDVASSKVRSGLLLLKPYTKALAWQQTINGDPGTIIYILKGQEWAMRMPRVRLNQRPLMAQSDRVPRAITIVATFVVAVSIGAGSRRADNIKGVRISPEGGVAAPATDTQPVGESNTGRYRFAYLRVKAPVAIQYEFVVWHKGERKPVGAFDFGYTRPAELRISSDEGRNDRQHPVRLVTVHQRHVSGLGGGSTTMQFPIPERLAKPLLMEVKEPVDLVKDKPVAVWGLLSGITAKDANTVGTRQFELAERAEWGLTLQVVWRDPPPDVR